MSIENMLQGYLACALWASTDEDGAPLDEGYSVEDFSPAARCKARDECVSFIALCEGEGLAIDAIAPEQFGHDLWLTRNGHGAGFWDRGLGALGETLTKWAKAAGTCDVIETDTNELSLS